MLKCMHLSHDFATADYNSVGQQCTQAPVGDMWSESSSSVLEHGIGFTDMLISDWSYLRGTVPPSEFFKFLQLPWWNSYTDADTLGEICRSTPYPQLIGGIFLLRSRAYKSWKPGHWLCTACLQTFLRDNIEAFCRCRGYPEQVDQ